jgi:hypothetical protein
MNATELFADLARRTIWVAVTADGAYREVQPASLLRAIDCQLIRANKADLLTILLVSREAAALAEARAAVATASPAVEASMAPLTSQAAPCAETKSLPPPATAAALKLLETRPNLERINDFPVDQIGTDPDSFQYKRSYEKKTGAGLALGRIKKCDPALAGRLTLCRADGNYWVVNGHQRLAAMKRLGIGTADVQVIDHGQMTKAEAKAYGFQINFAEGRGTPMDAASYMRLSGKTPERLISEGIFDLSESKQRDAIGRYNLAPALFRTVENKTLTERRGAMIGNEMAGNPAAQESLLKSLRRMEASKQGITDEKLQARIKFTKGAAIHRELQTDLFGTREQERSLVDQQADVYVYVRDRLAKDRRLFAAAAANEQRLGEGGTSVYVQQAQGIENAAARRLAVLGKFGGPTAALKPTMRSKGTRGCTGTPKRRSGPSGSSRRMGKSSTRSAATIGTRCIRTMNARLLVAG